MSAAAQPGVAALRLPGGLFNTATAEDIFQRASELREDRSIRVVVVESTGASFCDGPDPNLDRLAVDPAAAIAALRVPVVCAIGGRCSSVGLELALACDVLIARTGAVFSMPDATQGVLPCWGGTQRLSRSIRPAEATAMLLTGSELDAQRAFSLGLVHEVAEDLDAAKDLVVDQLLAVGPLALEAAKEAAHRGSELPMRDGLRLEGDLNHLLAATEDRAEGLQAFFEKRPPDFSGR